MGAAAARSDRLQPRQLMAAILPGRIANWTLISLQQRLVKTAGLLIKHARRYWLLLAESHLTGRLFTGMLRKIARLPVPTGDSPRWRLPNRLRADGWMAKVSRKSTARGPDRAFTSPETELAASSADRGLCRRKRSNPWDIGRICTMSTLARKVIMEIPDKCVILKGRATMEIKADGARVRWMAIPYPVRRRAWPFANSLRERSRWSFVFKQSTRSRRIMPRSRTDCRLHT